MAENCGTVTGRVFVISAVAPVNLLDAWRLWVATSPQQMTTSCAGGGGGGTCAGVKQTLFMTIGRRMELMAMSGETLQWL